MKRFYITAIVVCLMMLLAASFVYHLWDKKPETEVMVVGFLSENDEMTSGTYNFFESQTTLEKVFPEQIEFVTRTNVQQDETQEALLEMLQNGCRLIFAYTRSETVRAFAAEYPEVQFCQISTGIAAELKAGSNFHTFNAKSYEGQYVSGIAAGMKLKQMISDQLITPEQALVGYIGSFPTSDTISGFTAFILGVRTEVPEAMLKVRYVNSLSNFSREKRNARELIEEGCVIITQNSGSTGPAAACQEAAANKPVYYVGFNDNLIDIASAISIVSSRINWDPYMINAVQSVIDGIPLEKNETGEVHGNDVCSGFSQGWIEMIDLNDNLAAPGTAERMVREVSDLISGKTEIFKGNYIGTDPNNMRIKIDLNDGFTENSNSSKASFHYILRDIITVEKTNTD